MKVKYDLFDISIVAAGFLVPLIFLKFKVGFFQISIIEIIIPLMLTGFFLRLSREKRKLQFTMADKLYFLLLVWTGLSLLRAIDFTKSFNEWIWLVESGLLFYMLEHGVREKEKITRLIIMWSYGAVIIATLGLMHFMSSIFTGEGPVRISSTLLNANTLSGYLIIFIPILIALKYGKRLDQRIFWGILATIVSTALVATYTRGGWIAIILALIFMAVSLKDKPLIGFLVIYILIYSWAFPSASDRAANTFDPLNGTEESLSGFEDENVNYRLHLWLTGLKMAEEAPLAGVGVGNYYHLHDTYMDKYPEVGQGFKPLEPHNSFIKYLAETGLVGLGLFLSFLSLIAVKIFVLFKQLQRTPLVIGMIVGLVAFLLQSNTNSLFHDPRVAFGAWMLIGSVANLTGSLFSEQYGSSFPLYRLRMPTRGLKYEPNIKFYEGGEKDGILKEIGS